MTVMASSGIAGAGGAGVQRTRGNPSPWSPLVSYVTSARRRLASLEVARGDLSKRFGNPCRPRDTESI